MPVLKSKKKRKLLRGMKLHKSLIFSHLEDNAAVCRLGKRCASIVKILAVISSLSTGCQDSAFCSIDVSPDELPEVLNGCDGFERACDDQSSANPLPLVGELVLKEF